MKPNINFNLLVLVSFILRAKPEGLPFAFAQGKCDHMLKFKIGRIYIGPTLPAFILKNVFNILQEKLGLKMISAPEKDLNNILGNKIANLRTQVFLSRMHPLIKWLNWKIVLEFIEDS